MKKSLFLPLVLMALPAATPLLAEYAPNIRLNADMDAALRRLSIRYGVPPPASLYFQPVNVAELTSFLSKADSLDGAGLLSPEESFQIRELRGLFVEPRRAAGWRSGEQDKSAFVNVSLLGAINPSLRDSLAMRSRWMLSPGLSGNIGNLSFYSGIDVWTDWYTDTMFHASNYQPYNGNPYNPYNRADSAHLRSSCWLNTDVPAAIKAFMATHPAGLYFRA